jgi:hypothetical protein
MFLNFEEYKNDFLNPETDEKNNSNNSSFVHRIWVSLKCYWRTQKRKRKFIKINKRFQISSKKR